MTDAALGFVIDSSQADSAAQKLDQLKGSAQQLVSVHDQLSQRSQRYRAESAQIGDSTAAMRDQFYQATTALDTLLAKLDDARQKMNASSAGMTDFTSVRSQVDALALSFGTTSVALEGYTTRTAQLGLSSQQTIYSLQRITDALTAQTAAGRAIRGVMEDYGTSLRGLTSTDAEQALSRYLDKMRQVQDSAQKFKEVQAVLGPIDATTYARLNDPDVISFQTQRQRTTASAVQEQVAETSRHASVMARQTSKDQAQYDDLSGRYKLGVIMGGLTKDDMGAIGKALGPMSDFAVDGTSTQAGRLAAMRWLQANPDSAPAQHARTGGARADDTYAKTTGSWIDSFSNGRYAANEAEINAQYGLDMQRSSFWSLDRTKALLRGAGSDFQNLVGSYKPQTLPTDPKPDDIETGSATEVAAKKRALGGQLGDWGDESYARSRRSLDTLHDIGRDPGRSIKQFTDAYGPEDGGVRYYNATTRLKDEADEAVSPGLADVRSTALDGWIASQPADQQGKARALAAFARTTGTPTTDWASRRLSPAVLTDPAFGGGFFSPGAIGNFNQTQGNLNANAVTTSASDLQQDVDLHQKLEAAATGGSTAVQNAATYWNAYNAAIKAGRDETTAAVLATNAQTDALLKQHTVSVQMIEDLTRQNQLDEDRRQAMQRAGGDPVARGAAANAVALQQQAASSFLGKNDPLGQSRYLGQLQTKSTNDAIGAANDALAASQHDLDLQKQLLTVAGQRADVQAKMAADQKIDAQYAPDLAKAFGADAKSAIQGIIDKAKELSDQLRQVAQDAKNLDLARDLNTEADNTAYLMGLPASQRGRAQALGRVAGANGLPISAVNGAVPPEGRALLDSIAPGESDGSYAPQPSSSGAKGRYQFLDSTWREVAGQTHLSAPTPENQDMNAWVYAQQRYRQSTGHDLLADLKAGTDPSAALNKTWTSLPGGAEHNNATDGFPARLRQNLHLQGSPALDAAVGAADRNYDTQIGSQVQGIQEGMSASDYAAAVQRQYTRAGATGAGAVARAGVVDPNVDPTLAQAQAGARVAGVRNSQADSFAGAQGATDQEIEKSKALATAADASSAALASTTRMWQAHTEALRDNLAPAQEAARANQLLTAAITSAGAGAAQRTSEIRLQIADTLDLADAFKKGAAAGSEMQSMMKIHDQERTIEDLKAAKDVTPDQVALADKQLASLQKQRSATDALTAADQKLASVKAELAMADENASAKVNIDAGPFASDRQLQEMQAKLKTDTYIRDNMSKASPEDQQAYRDASDQNEALKERSQDMNDLRNAARGAGDAFITAFENAAQGGAKLKTVIAGLAKSIEDIGLNALKKPVENWFGDLVGGLGGAAGGAGAVGSEAGYGWTVAAAADGAVFGGSGRLSMYAAGGVVDRPTYRMMANGGTALIGEAGPEAVIPLARGADGNLGLKGGGGGGSQIMVHAPITVQNSGSGTSGGMDGPSQRQLQNQVEMATRQALKAAIAEEMRPGGQLWNGR